MSATLDGADQLVMRDERAFFEIVATTPDDVEAVDLLRRAKQWAQAEKAARIMDGDTLHDQRLSALLAKLNNEISYREDKRNRYRLWNAIKALWGQEGADRVKAWIEAERLSQ